MKKVIFIIAVLLTTSCRKEWQCESVTIMNGSTTVTKTPFTGSKDDMKDHEAEGTFDYGWYSQKTTCTK